MRRSYAALIALACLAGSAGAQTWVPKVSGGGLGDPLTVNPLNTDVLYGSNFSTQVYVSRDRGYTWQAYGSAMVGGGEIKSIAVSPRDTSQLLCGVEGGVYDRILKSTNGGVAWTQTWTGTFSYFGKPVEFKPNHPDTVYTMGSDTLWRSTDFGSTWQIVRIVAGFTAWCDAEIRPDSANIIYVGDYATGIWKSVDAGLSWKQVYTTSGDGEIPSIAIDPFNPRVLYASRYSGGGGLLKSVDGGDTWQCIPTPVKSNCATTNGGNSWWVTCSPTAPGYVYFGTYGATPGGVMISRDSGASWTNYSTGLTPSGLFNYGLLTTDTLTVVALQQDGIYKLQYPTGIHLLTPRGGVYWKAGSTQSIAWSDSGLYALKLEFSSDGGASWSTIADSLPASQTSYSWNVPLVESSSCRIRLRDRLFTSTADSNASSFAIYTSPLVLTAPNGGERLDAGSLTSISWNAIPPVANVTLFLSTDGGAAWSLITTVPASTGSFPWTVPDSPSSNCKILVVDAADSTIADTSDSTFAISATSTFRAAIRIVDNGGQSDSLFFGTTPGATDDIDSSLGETVLPPLPARGTFDVRWKIPGTDGTKLDLRDTLGGPSREHRFVGLMQPGGGGYPLSLQWNPDSLKTETFILRDTLTHGELLSADMRRSNSLVVFDSSVGSFEILECTPLSVTIGSSDVGWNLIALPLIVGDRRKATLFPSALSELFAFSGGYVKADTLHQGTGYWLKSGQYTATGCPLTVDTVDVHPGWNMIGSLSAPVSVSSIVSLPDSLIISNLFGYGGSGYVVASTLLPGRGYWVKVKAAGKLVLDTTGGGAPPAPAGSNLPGGLNRLIVSDRNGGNQALYFGTGEDAATAAKSELPPPPPKGSFDARFSSFRQIELYPKNLQNERNCSISVNSSANEIFFSWSVDNEENFTYILSERIGKTEVVETQLSGAGSCAVPYGNQTAFALTVRPDHGRAESPRRFSLEEAYPNPFNPTVHIGYDVPATAYVRIEVFNTLGERIAALYDGVRTPGRYRLTWSGNCSNGTEASSGVYFIRLTALDSGQRRGASRVLFDDVKKVALVR